MKIIGTMVVLGALSLLPEGTAQAASTFEDCASAQNYGNQTARHWVGTVMNRVSCADASVRKGENALAKQMRRQRINAHNPLSHQVCFYQGLYAGYIEGLETEAAKCHAGLELSTVAQAASAVFIAMQEAALAIDDGIINQVFDGIFWAPELEVDTRVEQCDDVINVSVLGDAADDDDVVIPDGLDELVASVCLND
jgi:hypothetical protein